MGLIKLENQNLSIAENPSANQKLIGFDTDGKLKQKDENGTITEIGSGGSLTEYLTINEFYSVINSSMLPMGETIEDNFFKRVIRPIDPHFIDSFSSHYTYSLFDIYVDETEVGTGQQFASYSAFVTYLNTNISITETVSIYIKQYLIVNNELKGFGFMNPKNNFYFRLRGSHYIQRNLKTLNVTGSTLANNFASAIYSSFLTKTLSGTTEFTNAKKSICFTRSHEALYSLYPDSVALNGLKAKSNSKLFNTSTNSWEDVSGVVDMQIVSSSYVVIEGNNIYVTSSVYDYDHKFNPKLADYNFDSMVKVYMLVDSDTGNLNQFIVKPVGIDSFYLPPLEDTTNAKLYGLFYRDTKIKKLREITGTAFHLENISWKVELADYKDYSFRHIKTNINKIFYNFVLFYAYDDGTCSPVSNEVVHILKSRGTKFKRMVKRLK